MAEYDERAARFAGALTAAGLGPDSKIGLYLYNSNEYLEAQFGGFKARAVPVNVNYRYLDDELAYLLDNADAEALVFHTSLGDRVARVRSRLPRLRLLVAVDDGLPEDGTTVDGAVPWEDALAAHAPMERIARREDDIYMLYTGGTTGMPKGVMYAMGGLTASFVEAGFPLLQLTPPADAVGDRAARHRGRGQGRAPDLDPRLPADARHRRLAGDVHPPPRRRHRDHAGVPVARRRRAARGRPTPPGQCHRHRR